MLEGLDSIAWVDLNHAHGSAANVPHVLRSLMTNDESEWLDARNKLREHINHQGSDFQCTPYVIPFLFELILDVNTINRHLLIYDLASIAIGLDCDHLPYGFNLLEFRKHLQAELLQLPEHERTMCVMGPHIDLECYDSVNYRAKVLIRRLSDEDEEVRIASAFTIAWFPEHPEAIRELEVALTQFNDQHRLIANFLLAYGLLSFHVGKSVDSHIVMPFLDHAVILVRVAAAISIAKQIANGKVIDALCKGAASEELEDVFNLTRFNEGRIQEYAQKVLYAVR